MKEITSLQHPLVKHFVKLKEDRKYRHSEKKVVVEGIKMVSEASNITKILVIGDSLIPERVEKDLSIEIYQVTEAILKKISGVESPEGIIAEVKIVELSIPENLKRLLILDGINDPGNLGTLIRSAFALGWEGIFLLPGCCDPYNDKALRAAKGATFHLPIEKGSIEKCVAQIKKWEMKPFVATLEGADVKTVKKQERIALILGNESKGPSEEMLIVGKAVTIPMSRIEGVESLNVGVAGSILMYALE